MRSRRIMVVAWSLALVALAAWPAAGTTVLKMDLDGLVANADRIFRGTVVGVEPGTMTIGGGELPTVTFRIAVEETFKGDFEGKSAELVEMIVVGNLKQDERPGGLVRFANLPAPPALVGGGDYLIFATQPSAAGLSTAVGLGQGAFKIFVGDGSQELAVNELGNLGLFDGPVAYSTLADEIRQRVGE